MKNIVRGLAFTLVVTGAFASAHLSNSAQPVVHSKVSAMPIPTCAPNDPSACDICSFKGTCGNSTN